MKHQTIPPDIQQALNQLASVLAGRELAIATNNLSGEPYQRIQEMADVAGDELVRAVKDGDSRMTGQAQRKLQSLESLLRIAQWCAQP